MSLAAQYLAAQLFSRLAPVYRLEKGYLLA